MQIPFRGRATVSPRFKRKIIIFSASLEFGKRDNAIKTGIVKGVASYCPIRRRMRDMHRITEGSLCITTAVERNLAPLLIKSDTSQQLAVQTRCHRH